jgi:hypothetical protein
MVMAIVGLLANIIFALFVAYGLYQYESAADCQPPHTSSRACLMRSSATVTKQISRNINRRDEAPDILHGVALAYTDGTCELWLRDMPAELKPQTKVELLRWRGLCIAVTVGGEERFSYYWEPGTAMTGIAWMIALPVAVFLLYRHWGSTDTGRRRSAIILTLMTFITALAMLVVIGTSVTMRLL